MKRLLLSILLSLPVMAQAQWPAGYGIEWNSSIGRIIKHTKNFRPPIPERSVATEINLVFKSNGSKDWQQRRNRPVLGCGLTITDYGNQNVFGTAAGIYPNLEMPLIRRTRWEWTTRVGFGLGYISKRYSRYPDWDTLNNVIGSHFNNFSIFSTDLRVHISKHWDAQTGVVLSHISNAAFRTPNLGINRYGFQAGLRYFPVARQPVIAHKLLTPLSSRWLLQLRAGISANEYGNGNGPLFPVYIASTFVSKRYFSRNKVFAGLDYAYYEGVYAFLRNNEILIGEERANSWKSSVFVGHEFLYGHFGIMLQFGYYLKNTYLRIDPYYQKLGANVYLLQREEGFLKELSTSVLLKTHQFQAELVEIGLGVGL